jgi:cell division protein FtsN
MSRDYKHTGTKKKRSKASNGPGWPLFLAGLAAGLCVALVVYMQQHAPLRLPGHPHPAPPAASAPAQHQAAKAQKKRTAAAVTPKPHFDFYTILPEMEVKVPEGDLYDKNGKEAAAAQGPGIFYLQVGSFRSFDEADRAKAKLALIGITADIQRVVMNSQDTWYRVRVGPFKDLKSSDATRRRLSENNMDFMVLRIKQPPRESAADKAAE